MHGHIFGVEKTVLLGWGLVPKRWGAIPSFLHRLRV